MFKNNMIVTENTRLLGNSTGSSENYCSCSISSSDNSSNECVLSIPKEIYADDYKFTLTYAEIVGYATDPFWITVRRITMIIFIIAFLGMFSTACTISILHYHQNDMGNTTDKSMLISTTTTSVPINGILAI